jgi:hypothetical protein
MDRLDREPIREVAIYKGCSVGPTVGVLENMMGYFIEQQRGKVIVHKAASLSWSTLTDEAVRFSPKPRARNVAEVGYGTDEPAEPLVFATMTEGDAARENQWTTSSSANPLDDIRAFFEQYNSPEAQAARRRAYAEEMRQLARLWERAGHGHLVPPPYRSTP